MIRLSNREKKCRVGAMGCLADPLCNCSRIHARCSPRYDDLSCSSEIHFRRTIFWSRTHRTVPLAESDGVVVLSGGLSCLAVVLFKFGRKKDLQTTMCYAGSRKICKPPVTPVVVSWETYHSTTQIGPADTRATCHRAQELHGLKFTRNVKMP